MMHAQHTCIHTYIHLEVHAQTGLQKLKKSSFEQALQNDSKQLQKLRFGHTFWSRQDIWILGLQKPPMPNMYVCMYMYAYVHT